jgi:Cdc6-like AAA superfamily ATPase
MEYVSPLYMRLNNLFLIKFLKAGAGKTKLVSKVVDHLTNYLHEEALAYFYCDRNQDPRRQPENILRSFVKQFAMSRDQDAIQHCLAQLYEQKHREGFSSNKMSFEECETLLIRLIQAYTRSFLILDALDECDQQLRGDLIEVFNRLVNTSKGLKIFISSRRDADLKHQLEKKSNVGIEATDNQKDISTFVAETIKRNQEVRRIPIPKGLQDRIVETLLEKSGGM